jgi:hypothetical protein
VRTSKGEPAVLKFLRIGIARPDLNFFLNVDTLIWHKNSINFLGERTNPMGIILDENQT